MIRAEDIDIIVTKHILYLSLNNLFGFVVFICRLLLQKITRKNATRMSHKYFMIIIFDDFIIYLS